MGIKEILDQLKKCNYECVAGSLKDNIAFAELEKKVSSKGNICCLGTDHKCLLNVNDGYCLADTCVNMVVERI